MEAIMLAYNDTLFDAVSTVCQHAVRQPNNAWFSLCENSERFRATGDRISIRLADLEARAPTGRGLERYIEGLQAAALTFVDSAILPVDYIEAAAWTDVCPYSQTQLPIARVWSVSDFMHDFVDAQNGFNLTQWLRNGICETTIPEPEAALCANQYATDSNDPCLWSSGAPMADRMQYWVPDGMDIVLHYQDSTTTRVPICKVLSTLGDNGACVVQYQGDMSRFLSMVGDAGQRRTCDIVRIEAPPGIEVQGFALSLHSDEWLNRLPPWPESGDAPFVFPDAFCTESTSKTADGSTPFTLDQIRSCTWTSSAQGELPQTSAWWYGNVSMRQSARPDLDGLRPIDAYGFGEMTDWWSPDLTEQWGRTGCASALGLCAVRMRLRPTQQGQGATACAPPVPSCASLTQSNSIHPFIVAGDLSADAALLRCAPCTRYRKRIALGADAIVRCEIDGAGDDVLGAIARSTTYLDDPGGLVQRRLFANGTARDIVEALQPLDLAIGRWGKRDSESPAQCDQPSRCFDGVSGLQYVATSEQVLWTEALSHPEREFTMLCQNQIYTEDQALRCDPLTDAPRQRLAEFVERRYREANGVWLPTLAPGTGLAWTSSVASNATALFSLMYASTHRTSRDVQTRWLMGDGPCKDATSVLQNRICVESNVRSELAFQALHPWLGGDFNPFDGFDQCASKGVQNALCACQCVPQSTCANPSHNYSSAQMALEFPFDARCSSQAFASAYIMDETDPSNLCASARSAKSAAAYEPQCLHTQGLLGDPTLARTVSAAELHSPLGVPTRPADFLVQDLYGADGQGNGLWAGRTLQQERATGLERYAFLRMDRSKLHPAHIAFATADDTHTGAPLLVSGLSLKLKGVAIKSDLQWVTGLQDAIRQDAAWVSNLYPQLNAAPTNPTNGTQNADWTCPLRVAAFWGGVSSTFAPVVPSPILAKTLYGLGGAHPLIRSRRARDALLTYVTTNGACYYQSDASPIAIDVRKDASNPCGLQGMIRLLQSGAYAPSILLTPDAKETIIDTPDLGATLRNDETLDGAVGGRVGALQRLSPFLIRTGGDVGVIQRSSTLSTRSEGGDCHMGRALLADISDRDHLAGAACSLVAKNATHALAECPADAPIAFTRARPLSLEALIDKKTRMYRDDVDRMETVAFVGPGGTKLLDAESSFGMLYSTTLVRALASDLLAVQTTENQSVLGAWRGDAFWSLFVENSGQSTQTRSEEAAQAAVADAALWGRANWTWRTSPNLSASSVGNVNRTRWLKESRLKACQESYHTFVSPTDSKTTHMMQPLSLCEPAPTPSLQAFCNALIQYRNEITNINCEVVGDCLYAPAAFYVPYAWSPTNQQFASDTVVAYYKAILQQPRFATVESYSNLCPSASSAWTQVLGQLSNDQAAQCPAYQLESIKRLIETLRLIIYDVIYMGYCLLMFMLNALGATASNDSATSNAAMQVSSHYLGEFLLTAEKIIMPILNAIVSTLFGSSSLGKIMSTALNLLCQMYNIFIKQFFLPIWCTIIRPGIYVILEALATLVSIGSSKAASDIRMIWTAISGGDSGPNPSSCLGSLAKSIDCSAGINNAPPANLSQFLAAPIATRCWADSSAQMRMAGAGPLGGMGDASFLTCTGSDTCAPDPLHFDATVGSLLACAACPLEQYGCDPALKRCTCGTAARVPDQCLASNDCMQKQCAVVSDLENAADATTNVPCSECGSLGMQIACVRSTGAGTCTCASVASAGTLQTCADRGQTVPLIHATGFCLSTDDISTNLLSPSLVLDFGALAITPCLLGLSDNGCVGVSLPLSSGGAYTRSLAVLLAPAPPASVYTASRRLLEVTALQCDQLHSRQAAKKECVHWRLAAHTVSNALSSNGTALELLVTHPLSASRRLMRHADGFAPRALGMLMELIGDPTQWTLDTPPKRRSGRRLSSAATDTAPIEWPFMYLSPSLTQSDRSCAVLDEAFVSIADAWTDTLMFYADTKLYEADPSDPTPLEDWINGTLHGASGDGWISVGNQNAGLLGNLAEAVTLGYGRRIVDAMVSERGRSMWSDMAQCNFTTLTLGSKTSVHRGRGMTLLYLLIATWMAFSFLMAFVLPAALYRIVWYVLFPAAVFWAAYGVSPLCWPMIPPRFPHDVVVELSNLLPQNGSQWTLPIYLVHEECDLLGRRYDAYDPTCFRTCDAEPFLFKSWQDSAAWWLCDLSASTCTYAAGQAARWSVLSDFVSSATYFVDVLAAPELAAAFRTCAAFTSFYLIFSMAIALLVLVALPSLLIAMFEFIASTLILLAQTLAGKAALVAP